MKRYIERIAREQRVFERLIRIYCRSTHKTRNTLCDDCDTLLHTVRHKLRVCILWNKKPSCLRCPVCCFTEGEREELARIRTVALPRLFFRAPFTALRYLIENN